MSLVEASFWTRLPGTSAVATAWRAIRLVVPGVLLAIVLFCGLAFLAVSTAAWVTQQPAAPIGGDPAPATVPPDFFDSPSPIPSIDIPDFDIPDFPSIPPLDPEGTPGG